MQRQKKKVKSGELKGKMWWRRQSSLLSNCWWRATVIYKRIRMHFKWEKSVKGCFVFFFSLRTCKHMHATAGAPSSPWRRPRRPKPGASPWSNPAVATVGAQRALSTLTRWQKTHDRRCHNAKHKHQNARQTFVPGLPVDSRGANIPSRGEITKVHPLEMGLSLASADTLSGGFCVCAAMPHFVYKALSVSFATGTRAGTSGGGRSTRTLTHGQKGKKHVTLTASGQLQRLSFGIKYEERRRSKNVTTGTSSSSSYKHFSQFAALSLSLFL